MQQCASLWYSQRVRSDTHALVASTMRAVTYHLLAWWCRITLSQLGHNKCNLSLLRRAVLGCHLASRGIFSVRSHCCSVSAAFCKPFVAFGGSKVFCCSARCHSHGVHCTHRPRIPETCTSCQTYNYNVKTACPKHPRHQRSSTCTS
jgi:hypothetical protein